MKKSTETVLAAGVAYTLMSMGIAIWRHPVISAIAFVVLFVLYAIDGPPFWEAVHVARSLAAIYGFVFIGGMACTGRGFAAYLWFIALVFAVITSQAWIECIQNTCYYVKPSWYATTLAPNGFYVSSLSDYHWWLDRHGWLPPPVVIAAIMLVLTIAIVKEVILSRQSNPVSAVNKAKRWGHHADDLE
jgi:hypothetical protein